MGRFSAVLRQTELQKILHEDPFTRRAFEKPRGYAGDAVLLDYIYNRFDNAGAPQLSDLGKKIWTWTTSSPPCRGVELRRQTIAKLIDQQAVSKSNSRILSVAAGHLRESRISEAVRNNQVGEIVALDNDEKSLEEIEKSNYGSSVVCCLESAKNIITGRVDIGTFDLIYSSGLYDYLNDGTGSRLTKRLFSKLNSGGKLFVDKLFA